MEKKDTDGNTLDIRDSTDSLNSLQVRYRLRTLLDLAITIGRREGMFKSLPPLAEDVSEKGFGERKNKLK